MILYSDKTSAYISFKCPFCKQHLKAPPEMADDQIECPACHKQIQVPNQDHRNKALFYALAGLAIGAIVVCFYYNTLGKIHRTETTVLTNYVTERQTNWINQTAYITETNIVVKTNIVAKPIFLWTEIKVTNNAHMNRKVYQ